MPSKEREDARIVSVRLPNPLVQRLDRVLDWQTTHRRRPATRNAALREALRSWLDEQEQLAGLLEPQALPGQLPCPWPILWPPPLACVSKEPAPSGARRARLWAAPSL